MGTLINVILDESGSMATKTKDVIGGYNRFLEDQKKGPDECRLSLTKFNTICTVVHTARQIAEAQPLTEQSYTPGGNTALLDAVAQTVRLADADKKPDERVLVLVITDGEENSSRETTKEQMQAIVKEREGRGDWTFTYLGVSPDQWAARGVTTSAMNNAAYRPDQPDVSFAAMSAATHSHRGSKDRSTQSFYSQTQDPKVTPAPAPVDDTWKAPHP